MVSIHDVMTLRPVVVTPGASPKELTVGFDRHDFNASPVVPRSLLATRVKRIMRGGVVVVEPEDSPVVTAELMVETPLHSLPVVRWLHGSPRELVGMVSQGDLLRGLRLALTDGGAGAERTRPARARSP